MDVLNKKRKIVVIAGAGISVSAGIPDFRSATGLFNSLRKQHGLKSSGKDLFDASVYQDDTSTSTFHDMVRSLSHATKEAKATPFHHLIATLAQQGRLMRLYTQNVDGIDTSLPPLKTQVPLPKKGPWPKTLQLHGGLDHMVCSKCHSLSDFDAAQFDGPVPPACPQCLENDQVRLVAEKRSHGIGRLRPRMVLYNEHNPDDEAIGSCTSLDLRTRPDAIIVAGTTLKVPGVRRIAREMCAVVRDRRDGVAIWINNDPEPLGKDLANSWDIVVKGPCDKVAELANFPQWDQPPPPYKPISDEEMAAVKEKSNPKVVIKSPSKPASTPKRFGAVNSLGQLTPGASPLMQPQFIKSESSGQPSPSKKQAAKRKSGGGQLKLLGSDLPKAQKKSQPSKPRKKAPAKPRGKKADNVQSITSQFGASKRSTAPKTSTASKAKDAKFIAYEPTKENCAILDEATHKSHSLKATPGQEHVTPKKSIKIWRADPPMVDLFTSDSRINSGPRSPTVEPFTSPVKPENEEYSRPSSSSSDVIHPQGPRPNFSTNILCE